MQTIPIYKYIYGMNNLIPIMISNSILYNSYLLIYKKILSTNT